MENLAIINEQELKAKQTSWGTFGGIVYKTEISIQNKASSSIASLWLPSNIEEIADAEQLLKQLKATKNEVQEERKAITTKADELTKRLMIPEKSFDEPVKVLEQAIIKIKKEYEIKQAEERAKLDEKKQLIEILKNHSSTVDANFKTIINNKVTAAFNYALGDFNLEPKSKEQYIQKCCDQITEATFPTPKPNFNPRYLTPEEVSQLQSEHFVIDKTDYITLYAVEIEKKFSDFDVAFHNKAEALAQSKREKEEKDAEIAQQQQQFAMAAKLEAVSETMDAEPTLFSKALKKSYEVDMPETIESVLAIQGAFAANIQICLPKLNVKKWFAFTPEQAAKALAKVKCDDNKFQPAGIIFKEVDKL